MATKLEEKLALAKANGGALAERKGDTIFDLIRRQQPAFQQAMPRMAAFDVERFVRVAMTSLRMNPRLAQCDEKSLLAALMLSAQLGLEPGGPLGHAYLVPYGRELTFIVGYKGFMELARRSGRISDIYAETVREGDTFEVQYGLHRDIVHKHGPNRGELTHVYAVATYKDGSSPSFVVLDKARVESFRKRSKAGNNGPWVTDTEAMWRKTAVRRLATWLPLSVEMAQAAAADEQLIVDSTTLEVLEQPALEAHDEESQYDNETGEKTTSEETAVAPQDGLKLDG